ADVFAIVVDPVTAAHGRVVLAENIPRESEARSPSGRDAVLECGSGGIAAEAGNSQLIHATGVDERIRTRLRQVGLDVADVAGAVGPRAEELGAKSKVDGQVFRCLPVILREDSGIVLAIVMVVDATPAETELHVALQHVLEVTEAVAGIGEEKLPVEYLR